jgi:hypothetical protein
VIACEVSLGPTFALSLRWQGVTTRISAKHMRVLIGSGGVRFGQLRCLADRAQENIYINFPGLNPGLIRKFSPG